MVKLFFVFYAFALKKDDNMLYCSTTRKKQPPMYFLFLSFFHAHEKNIVINYCDIHQEVEKSTANPHYESWP